MGARWVTAILAVVLLVLGYQLLLDRAGLRAWWRVSERIESQQRENDAARTRNELLAAEVRDLKQGLDAVEERARWELGMIRRGEIFFQHIEPAPPTDD
ncbi:MAG: cell division protein FtsB [Pseudomonadota bacterium]|nr:cell division protein FtsB [Pseudomonadota bacterium]HJO36794.1 cell division protein FtsB [Gammaproteobacteria bacterium]